jgi:hypothetical protein
MFIKLTMREPNNGLPVHVNVNHIMTYVPFKSSAIPELSTRVLLTGSVALLVHETPEQINRLRYIEALAEAGDKQ